MDQDELSKIRVNEEVERQSKIIDNYFCYVFILLFLSVFLPVLLVGFIPSEHSKGEWFAKGGSITVMLLVWAEFLIFSIYELMKPVSGDGVTWDNLRAWPKLRKRYYKKTKNLSLCILLPSILGTLIWGYGDLVWKFFHPNA